MAYSNFHAEVMGLVAQITGGVLSDQEEKQTLFTSVESAHVSIVKYMQDGLAGGKGRPRPPYYAVQIGHMRHDPEWGVRSRTYRAPVTFAKIDAEGNTDTNPTQQSMHADADALATAFEADGETYQSPPELPEIDSSSSNVVFQSLAAQSKVNVFAVTVTWEPGFLVQR